MIPLRGRSTYRKEKIPAKLAPSGRDLSRATENRIALHGYFSSLLLFLSLQRILSPSNRTWDFEIALQATPAFCPGLHSFYPNKIELSMHFCSGRADFLVFLKRSLERRRLDCRRGVNLYTVLGYQAVTTRQRGRKSTCYVI